MGQFSNLSTDAVNVSIDLFYLGSMLSILLSQNILKHGFLLCEFLNFHIGSFGSFQHRVRLWNDVQSLIETMTVRILLMKL